MQSAQEILKFAEHYVSAIERGDVSAVRACYAPDAKLWHNTDGLEQTLEDSMKVLGWMVKTLTDRRYRIVRREALSDGFLQQHVLEATLPSGDTFRMSACCVVRMKDGVITRTDEYLDSAATKVLRDLLG